MKHYTWTTCFVVQDGFAFEGEQFLQFGIAVLGFLEEGIFDRNDHLHELLLKVSIMLKS